MKKQTEAERLFAYHRPTSSRQYKLMAGEENKDIFLLLNNYGAKTPNLLKPEATIEKVESAHKCVRELAEKLCEKYPEISTYQGVFNGKPHLKGTRFTVADVLSAICEENSIESVIEEYDNRYTEEQLKEALRYARDFLLSAYSLP